MQKFAGNILNNSLTGLDQYVKNCYFGDKDDLFK